PRAEKPRDLHRVNVLADEEFPFPAVVAPFGVRSPVAEFGVDPLRPHGRGLHEVRVPRNNAILRHGSALLSPEELACIVHPLSSNSLSASGSVGALLRPGPSTGHVSLPLGRASPAPTHCSALNGGAGTLSPGRG